MHAGAAVLTGVTFMQLRPDEADLLTSALADVLDRYQINIEGPGGVWLGLITAVGVIYGPRYFMFQQLVRSTRAKPVSTLAPTPAEVAANGMAPINYGMDKAA